MRKLAMAVALMAAAGTAAPAAHAQSAAGIEREHPTFPLIASPIVEMAPAVDGRLDDWTWTEADRHTFVQRAPHPGRPSAHATAVRVMYGRDALYVAMRMFDSAPDSIAAQLTRRDVADDKSDWVHVYLDSYHDRRTAFRFSVNPRGVQADALHFGDTQQDTGWDAVWNVSTQIDAEGWTAEFRIPLSQLRFASADGAMTWGVNFGREIARYGEQAYWAPIPADAGAFVSAFGRLEGLRDLPTPRRLEIQPYTVSRLTRAPGTTNDPFYRTNAVSSTAGADLRYGVTSDFTLNVAVNPDFGQVEADPSQVNLSAFETFFPEKRQFFVEGTDLFQLTHPNWPPVVYSRRIGRRPQGPRPAEAEFATAPDATTILGATKLTGKTSGGLSLAALGALTAEESLQYTVGADQRAVSIEPTTTYGAARIIQDFRDGQSAIGGIVTSTNRAVGAEHEARMHSAAYVAGVDGRHRWRNGTYEIAGSVLASHVTGHPEAIARTQQAPTRYLQRPDATHLSFDSSRTSLAGMQTGIRAAKIGGGHWRWDAQASYTSPEFENNDLGFLFNADVASVFGRVLYNQFRPQGIFRQWRVGTLYAGGWTSGGERRHSWVQLFGDAQLANQTQVFFGLDRTFSSYSTSELRGGPSLYQPGYLSSWASVDSDPRRAVTVGFHTFGNLTDAGQGYHVSVGPRVSIRPTPQLDLRLQPNVRRNVREAQYVTSRQVGGNPGYVFGRLRQTTTSLTARLNYTFSPTLSLQLYAQPFLSSGRYDRFRLVDEPRNADVARRFTDVPVRPASDGNYDLDLDGDGTFEETIGSPDFAFQQFRSNLVVRWEYRPGSTVFLVWGQDRTAFGEDGRFRLGRGVDDLFAADGTNVFLLKINYWLGR